MGWRLYYVDRTRFTSDDGNWQAAPAWGVGALVPVGFHDSPPIETNDFYLWDPDAPHPWNADAWGLMDLLLRQGLLDPDRPLTSVPATDLTAAGVKFGRSLDTDSWQQFRRWVIDDLHADGIRKDSHYRTERR